MTRAVQRRSRHARTEAPVVNNSRSQQDVTTKGARNARRLSRQLAPRALQSAKEATGRNPWSFAQGQDSRPREHLAPRAASSERRVKTHSQRERKSARRTPSFTHALDVAKTFEAHRTCEVSTTKQCALSSAHAMQSTRCDNKVLYRGRNANRKQDFSCANPFIAHEKMVQTDLN